MQADRDTRLAPLVVPCTAFKQIHDPVERSATLIQKVSTMLSREEQVVGILLVMEKRLKKVGGTKPMQEMVDAAITELGKNLKGPNYTQ